LRKTKAADEQFPPRVAVKRFEGRWNGDGIHNRRSARISAIRPEEGSIGVRERGVCHCDAHRWRYRRDADCSSRRVCLAPHADWATHQQSRCRSIVRPMFWRERA